MKLHAFMFMGRPGSGKGTQANLLIETLKKLDPSHPVLHIETGAELRAFNNGPTYTAALNKKTQDKGNLLPEFMPIYAWAHSLTQRFTGNEHVIFDGSPRKILEGQLMESMLPYYDFEPHLVYLDVDHGESKKRLLLRGKTSGRKDDTDEAIERRKADYEAQTHPTVEYFKKGKVVKFHGIDGVGSIEDVHERLIKDLNLQ
jgi:adenylate kinase